MTDTDSVSRRVDLGLGTCDGATLFIDFLRGGTARLLVSDVIGPEVWVTLSAAASAAILAQVDGPGFEVGRGRW